MELLLSYGRGQLWKLTSKPEKRKFNQLFDVFHPQGHARGPMMRGKRDLVYTIRGDWCVLMTIHKLNNLRVSQIYRLDMESTWMLRRIVTIPSAKTKYGDVAVEALKALEEYLRRSGEEAIITLTLPRHSGGLYKKAGYTPIGRTVRGDMVWWLLRLR